MSKQKSKEGKEQYMDRDKLLSIVTAIKSGTSVNGQEDSMGYFYFSGKNIISYNGIVAYKVPLKTPFSTFIRANDLFNLLSKTKPGKILFKQSSGGVKFKTKHINADLATIEDKDYISKIKIIQKSSGGKDWTKIPDNFVDIIGMCEKIHVSTEVESVLSCASINKKTCISSDNQRVVKGKFTSSMDDMLLQCSEIGKLRDHKPVLYSISKAFLHFKNEEGWLFSIRKKVGKFPSFDAIFDFKGTKFELPSELTEGIDAATIFVDSFQPFINLSLEENKCILSIKSQYGKIKYNSKIKYKGKEISFGVNPEFLKSMLKHSTTLLVDKDKTKLRLETKEYSMITALYSEE